MFSNFLSFIGLVEVHEHTLKQSNTYFGGDTGSTFFPVVERSKGSLGLLGLKALRPL